jgi:hypothetical protein
VGARGGNISKKDENIESSKREVAETREEGLWVEREGGRG